jgi:hypothetical protein
MEPVQKDTSNSDDWVRQFALSEEYLLRHHPRAAGGYYRRFESPHVIDLVRVRRERARPKQARPKQACSKR